MKKYIAILLALVLLLGMMTGCGKEEEAETEATTEAVTEPVVGAPELLGWAFDAYAWVSNNGANVTFSGTPAAYTEGDSAVLSVWLEGDMIESVTCQWTGSAYTATVDLNAADGYCYYCTITAADGSHSETELNTPKNTTAPLLINLDSALASYCSMMVEESSLSGSALTLTQGYIEVQLPLISQNSDVLTIVSAQAVLSHEGEEVDRADLTLTEGETDNSFTGDVSGVTLTVPQLEDDQQLDLTLELTLSDGQTMTAPAGSWYSYDGDLLLAVG